jgi:phage host-nuclease inhibitor protein Gam
MPEVPRERLRNVVANAVEKRRDSVLLYTRDVADLLRDHDRLSAEAGDTDG